jgi:hypothetical protein
MELMSLLEEDRNIAMQERLNEVAEALGEGGASRRAAERVVERVRAWATEMSNNRKDKSEYEETITEEP